MAGVATPVVDAAAVAVVQPVQHLLEHRARDSLLQRCT